MELFPPLELTWLGGWLMVIGTMLVSPIALALVSDDVRKRLLDRSTFTTSQWILTTIGKIFSLTVLIVIIFTPLSSEPIELLIGVILVILGIGGEVYAILNFITTSLDEPVTKGLYRISRNPQETMIFVSIFGACLAVGSISCLILLLTSRIFNHFQILAQEESCLKEYGESYQLYMEKVPRYFLFF
jgi:protein-S-isoprenylcysteine O-methyltransferase Ste14